ncbi:MAG: hypothetical protein M1819_002688 [Sarea resinae]|nr:MAG: hypothetical protein M1819_002688 [Sarea resinae]
MDPTCNPREAFPPNSIEAADMDEDLASSTFTKSRTGSFSSSLPEFSASPESSQLASLTSPLPEKKQPKKRKAWGQVLPTPTTNLPPRKRAKTQAEKEQRRVERIMRNRNAAQTSREKKREAYEKLENEKKAAEERAEKLFHDFKQVRDEKLELEQKLEMMSRHIRALEGGTDTGSKTLSRDLLDFDYTASVSRAPDSPIQTTVDPRTSFPPSPSPPTPLQESVDPLTCISFPSTTTVVAPAMTPNSTQRPAEPLCEIPNDQQCQLGVVEAVSEQHRPLLAMMVLLKSDASPAPGAWLLNDWLEPSNGDMSEPKSLFFDQFIDLNAGQPTRSVQGLEGLLDEPMYQFGEFNPSDQFATEISVQSNPGAPLPGCDSEGFAASVER